jgi:GT2 family glycosyltransferase
MQVPVIILNWNGWEDTFDCLRSLREREEASCVWLADNGSREDRSDEAVDVLPGLRVLQWDENYGYTGGYNRALKVAANEGFAYAYILNNDSEVTEGFLHSVVAAAEADPGLAAVGSVIAFEDPPGYAQYDGALRQPGTSPLGSVSGIRPTDCVSGCGALVRLRAMEEAGYFDERLFCYCEDLEWSWRMLRRGWRHAVCGESVVIHRGTKSDFNANAHYYITRNQFLMADRYQAEHQPLARRRAVYFALAGAQRAQEIGDRRMWEASAAALRDGMAGRFGKRSEEPLAAPFLARLKWLLLCARIRDKWRSVRGLHPGYAVPPGDTETH